MFLCPEWPMSYLYPAIPLSTLNLSNEPSSSAKSEPTQVEKVDAILAKVEKVDAALTKVEKVAKVVAPALSSK